jgi:class 3 adenylate cyclase/tetratricopeptide (TPR) repeat protein
VNCVKCGAALPQGARFCSNCGSPVPERDDAGVANRKVTVCFADLSGFTAMSEKLEPEEVRDVMSSVFSAASAIVRKHGGQIDKLIGDCVMSVFGLTETREDDAVRAIRAAMEISGAVAALNTPELRARIGRDLSVHTGINTGMVVAGELDLDKGTEKVLGDTVNVASRLASVAVGGQIVAGQATLSDAERLFEFEELGSRALKGKGSGVPAFLLKGPRRVTDGVRRMRGRRADFVGRGKELALLLGKLEALAGGRGGCVFVRGEAGTGKSRLVDELRKEARREGVSVVSAYCYESTRGAPYSLWLDLLNRLFEIGENEDRQSLRAKIDRGASWVVFEGRPVAPFIAALFSLESGESLGLDPGYLSKFIDGGICALVSSVCARAPTVVVLDDLHWADPSSLSVLSDVLGTSGGLFLCLHRPSADVETLAEQFSSAAAVATVRLEPLGGSDSAAMLRSLLQDAEPPRGLAELLSERVKGNPFYIEETVNELLESGALARTESGYELIRDPADIDVPSTVQGIIAARIDRLQPERRKLLQTASVVGQRFFRSIIDRLEPGDLDASIEDLKERDLISEAEAEPDIEYMFKHALMQDVVYNSLLRKDRRLLHARVAAIMEATFAERIGEFYETVAYHYRQSGDARKAVEYLMKAGRKSLSRYAAAEANDFYRHAYDLLANNPADFAGPETVVGLINDWSLVLYYYGDFVTSAALHERHLAEAEQVPDPELRGMFHAWHAWALHDTLRFADAQRAAEKALEIGRSSGNKRLTCYALSFLGWILSGFCDYDRALACVREAVDLFPEFDDDGYIQFKTLNNMAQVLGRIGYVRQAMELFDRLLDLGERTMNSRAVALGHNGRGVLLSSQGRLVEAEEEFRKALEHSRDEYYDIAVNMGYALHLLASGAFDRLGEVADAIARAARGRNPLYELSASGFGAVVEFSRGSFTRAFRAISTLRQRHRQAGSLYNLNVVESAMGGIYKTVLTSREKVPLGTVLRNLPWVLANVPFAFRKSEAAYLRAMEYAERMPSPGLTAQAHLDLGSLYSATGRREKALPHLAEAERLFAELANDSRSAEAKALTSKLEG